MEFETCFSEQMLYQAELTQHRKVQALCRFSSSTRSFLYTPPLRRHALETEEEKAAEELQC